MKEIEYRVWNPNRKEFLYDSLRKENECWIYDFCSDPELYTGIKDKKNQKIFENDFIKDLNQGDMVFKVVYVADVNEPLGMDCGWYLTNDDFENFSMLECRSENYEVVGDIHQNLELLVK
jgi:hypothetical protein